jgi:hypothetical protein
VLDFKQRAGPLVLDFKQRASLLALDIKQRAGLLVLDMKQRAGLLVLDFKQRAGLLVLDFKQRACLLVLDFKQRAGLLVLDFKQRASLEGMWQCVCSPCPLWHWEAFTEGSREGCGKASVLLVHCGTEKHLWRAVVKDAARRLFSLSTVALGSIYGGQS